MGDYTLRLASVLKRRGEDVFCISLADRFIPAGEELADQNSLFVERHLVPIKRLSEKLSWIERISILQNLLDEFQPDWISLQYVPYGFDKRGLPINLPVRLGSLSGSFRWHIMFHELCIGTLKHERLKSRLTGLCQQWIARRLGSILKPRHVNTTNEYYSGQLASLGIRATVLPLFSNIPLHLSNECMRSNLLSRCGLNQSLELTRIYVIFGTIHPEWDSSILLDTIRLVGDQALIVSIGRTGSKGQDSWFRIAAQKTAKLHFLMLGELSHEEISRVLLAADYGVSTGPIELAGKSSTLAAMKEHGLPVIVTRRLLPWSQSKDDQIVFLESASYETHQKLSKTNASQTIERVCLEFLESLQMHPKKS